MSLPHDRKPVADPETASQALALVARAVDAFRAGSFVHLVESAAEGVAALAVETAGEAALGRLAASSPLLVLTHARARTLKLRLYTPGVVAIPLAGPLNPGLLQSIADPTADLAEPLKGPFETLRGSLPNAYSAAVRLAKLGGLLPAVIAGPALVVPEGSVELPVAAITGYDGLVVDSLKLVTRARVPLEGAQHAELVAFRAGGGEPEHFAVLIGDPPRDPPVLTRLHSECFTGDFLGSLRCDCGAQLRGAVETISNAGGGVLLYLAQEGRGIGLMNKLRAYRLQDQGFDTMDANERLGFESDERLYGIAARMLTLLGFRSVRVLTNNPDKVEALRAAGIEVAERVPHAFPANDHNRAYLNTKADKAGHLF